MNYQNLIQQIQELESQIRWNTDRLSQQEAFTTFQNYYCCSNTTNQQNKVKVENNKKENVMENLKLAFNNPNLKVGDLVRVMTDEELTSLGRTRKTTSFYGEHAKYICSKIFRITPHALEHFQNKNPNDHIHLEDFEVFKGELSDNYAGWYVEKDEFVVLQTTTTKEVTAYQVLKLNFENSTAENVLLSFDQEKCKAAKEAYEKVNKDDKIKYIIIDFKMKTKVKE